MFVAEEKFEKTIMSRFDYHLNEVWDKWISALNYVPTQIPFIKNKKKTQKKRIQSIEQNS